ncbi:ferredoxin reductase family protein [Marinospirillum perlucidum]|uniref:ferredoxin reductase family protein n=1 Tax=Marinospirillum perlucidum TaxID=1982602 RepID=UPI00138FDF76|nr:ferric reductase-like transmembrane domain-containing protein [Marinospirillum perlucidum]
MFLLARSTPWLLVFIGLQLFFWAGLSPDPAQTHFSFDSLFFFSGYLAINSLSLAMFLASRPAWLEPWLGGLDHLYRLHRRLGIIAALTAVGHWLLEEADSTLKHLLGRSSLQEPDWSGWLENLQEAAEEFGEIGFYLLILLVAISFLRFFPYRYWRYLHLGFPVIYLLLAWHSLLLTPLEWWQQPLGWLEGGLLLVGSLSALLLLTGRAGRRKKVKGQIEEVVRLDARHLKVRLRLDKELQGYQPGQFARITFNRLEGAHPFTLVPEGTSNNHFSLYIKTLGDYTRQLHQHLHSGQGLELEGPYGRFLPLKNNSARAQIWVAGGVGITPFLACLQARKNQPGPAVSLHYATPNAATDPLVDCLNGLAGEQQNFTWQLHDSSQGQRLTADRLALQHQRADLWYCGPASLGQVLQTQAGQAARSLRFYQEAFRFR